MMRKVNKIVVFTGDPNYSVRKGVMAIDKQLGGLDWLILVHSPKYSLIQTARRQWRNLKRHGWRRVPDMVSTVYARATSASPNPPSPGSPGLEYAMENFANLPNVRRLTYRNIHSKEAVREVKQFRADLGLSLAAPILRKSLFDAPTLGTLNLHKGKVPEYKGMPPAFWEMWNGESSIGCTVHWVAARLDAGAVALSSAIPCEEYSTVKGLQLRLDELGNELMREAVNRISQGEELGTAQGEGGHTYRQPTLKQVAELNRRLAARRPRASSGPWLLNKDLLKRLVFVARGGLHRLVPPRVTVLLYHRVTDSARDNLTTGIEQFDRQMALLRRHFNVISPARLLQLTEVPRSDRPSVCVTFDDGYLDNYVNAFPILLKNQMDAGFFVSTGLIGTNRKFPHDVRRGNDQIPMMEWEHLVEMHQAGFMVGSHTVNHIDCAASEEELVRNELLQSMDDIRSRTGAEEVAFAYPYGGKQNMSPERLEIVKEVGYAGCLSAYGGSNVGHVDRFNVLRRGIHWEFSDDSFLCAALGLF
jgi:peptidoglycan/xylan/chitin deacetylase (PgdA/CDA1 family)/folate-dependent phosphoribosylglycinamide formyltransferase PurN